MQNEDVEVVLALVRELVRKTGTGCCCEDALKSDLDRAQNNAALKRVAEVASEKGHVECMAVAEAMLSISRTQRAKLIRDRTLLRLFSEARSMWWSPPED